MSKVTNAEQMFEFATSFNQNLCSWSSDIQDARNGDMFRLSGCPTASIDNGTPSDTSVCHSCVQGPGVTVIHTKHQGGSSGRYFYFTKKVWVDEIGAYGKDGKFSVNQWRDDKLIWSGLVIVWDNGNGIHGRREPYGAAKDNQWKEGDVITIGFE